jgi:heparosan-N-sulfate-glucuronate 5-epimerase
MTQALGVSVLPRAHQLTGDEKYMATARRAMGWISKPVEDGGCSFRNENGTWIEEYPNASDPNHVLNGHMWALFGVWDFYRATQDENAKTFFLKASRLSNRRSIVTIPGTGSSIRSYRYLKQRYTSGQPW